MVLTVDSQLSEKCVVVNYYFFIYFSRLRAEPFREITDANSLGQTLIE